MHNIINEMMNFAVHLINILGYPGIVFAGALEFLGLPVSGEILVPAVGLMVSKSHLNFLLVFITLTIGSILGTLVLYAVGYYFSDWAESFIHRKLAKYSGNIDKLNDWIQNHSGSVNLFTRFIPFLRVYISIFSGIERIKPVPFLFFSSIGIGLWNLILLLLGYYLGDNLDNMLNFVIKNPYITVLAIVILLLILIIAYFLYRKARIKKSK